MNPYKDIQPRIQSIPQERIIRKMDEYMSRRDYAGAERHLKYWLEEAKMGNDRRGELLIRNELVGHFRKTGNRKEALQNGDKEKMKGLLSDGNQKKLQSEKMRRSKINEN